MNRKELIEALDSEGFGSGGIYFGDGLPSHTDTWAVQEDRGLWQVYYYERGERLSESWFADESSACTFLIERFRKHRNLLEAKKSKDEVTSDQQIDRQAHWNAAYTAKAETQVSWFQEAPVRSLAMIAKAAPTGSVIDVGGGASRLVDALLDAKRDDVTVLDISHVALERAKARLGDKAARIHWICADITEWRPERTWDVWHDRAVFHFLTDVASQDAYMKALMEATHPGSSVILSAFAPTGPERCSGLPVQRYSPASLKARLGRGFVLEDEALEAHVTPWGAVQDFAYVMLKRT